MFEPGIDKGCTTLKLKFFQKSIRWSEDSSAIEFMTFSKGDSTLWRQEIVAGSEPKKLAVFKGMEIYNFKRVPDSQDMIVSHGESENQVLMLSLNQ